MRHVLRLAVLCTVALAASAQQRLLLGPELRLGDASLHAWPYAVRPAVATNGDETLIAFIGSGYLYVQRLDRHGVPVTAMPQLISPNAYAGLGRIAAVWAGGTYVIFHGTDATRVTHDGLPIDHRTIANLPPSPMAAVHGDEIVVAGSRRQLLRLRADLTPLGTVDPAGFHAVSVAAGDEGFVVLSTSSTGVLAQFLRGGILGAPVRIGVARGNERESTAVAWTGSEYAASWNECHDSDCLRMFGRFGRDGQPIGEPRALRHVSTYSSNLPPVVTALDRETVFVVWDEHGQRGLGLRFRRGEPLDPAPVAVGSPHVVAIATAHGLLVTADQNLRGLAVASAATAPLPAAPPLREHVRSPRSELLLGAAASATEVAVLKRVSTTPALVVSVLKHDGTPMREVELPGAVFGAVASDGNDLYAVTYDAPHGGGPVWFRSLAPGATPKVIGSAGFYITVLAMAWNGTSFTVAWVDKRPDAIRVVRVEPSGTTTNVQLVYGDDARGPLELAGAGGRSILGWVESEAIRLAHLGERLEPGPIEQLDRMRDPRIAMTATHETVLFASWELDRIELGTRRHGDGHLTRRVLASGPGQIPRALTAAGERFVAVWSGNGLRIACVDRDEELLATADVDLGYSHPVALVALAESRLLLLYARPEPAAPFDRLLRTFLRTIAIEDPPPPAPRRRAVR